MFRLWHPAVLPLALAASILATSSDPQPQAVDRVFAHYDHTSTPGCALGVFRDGKVIYTRGYGMADLNQGTPITPATVFYIASTSKQFTAMSIALLAEQGKISLDDGVRKWVPELPLYAEKITIRHLVHHTSGIRDYLGLWALSGRSIADEIPEAAALDLISRQRAVDFEPGSEYSYSNSGYFLLSVIVKRASGLSLRQFAQANIFGPLGLTSTHFHDNGAEIVPRRAEGYQPSGVGGAETEGNQPSVAGGFEIVRTSFAGVGDGGLLTTVTDLAKWDENFFGNRLGSRGQGLIDQVTTVGRLTSGEQENYAFGLMTRTYRGLPVIDHGGAFIGFRAQLMRFPTQHFSVAILCNDYTAAPERLAEQVADLFLGDKLSPAGGPHAVSGVAVPAARLDRWVGRYEVAPGFVGQVARTESGLTMTVFGGTFPLAATNDSTFTLVGPGTKMEFHTTAAGPTLRAPGFGSAQSQRLGAAPTLTPAAAAAYAGRYRSEELDTWADIEAKGDTVKARTRWSEWRVLEPVTRDMFVVPGVRVAFDRDKSGRVSGFRMSQVRTHNVGFRRVR